MASRAPDMQEYVRSVFDDLNDYLESGTSFRVLVAGKTGVGKSSLINSLTGGAQIAKEGATVKSVTSEVVRYVTRFSSPVQGRENEDILFTAWDSPGFGDVFAKKEDLQTRLEDLIFAIEKADVLLYCFKISERITKDDTEGIAKITEMIHPSIWKKAVFVLTFSNELKVPPTSECTSPDQYLVEKLDEWKEVICLTLENMNIPDDIVADVSIVPAGYRNQNPPDRDDWYTPFWIELFKKTSESGKPGLLRLTWSRFNCQEDKAPNFNEQHDNLSLPVHLFNSEDKFTNLIDVGNLAEYLPTSPRHSLPPPLSVSGSTPAHSTSPTPPLRDPQAQQTLNNSIRCTTGDQPDMNQQLGTAQSDRLSHELNPHVPPPSHRALPLSHRTPPPPHTVPPPSHRTPPPPHTRPPPLHCTPPQSHTVPPPSHRTPPPPHTGPPPSHRTPPPSHRTPPLPHTVPPLFPRNPPPPSQPPQQNENMYVNIEGPFQNQLSASVGGGNPTDQELRTAARPSTTVSTDNDPPDEPARNPRLKKAARIGAIVGASAVAGALIGMLIGIVGGPIGMGIGAAGGFAIGGGTGAGTLIANAVAKFRKKKKQQAVAEATAENPSINT